MMSGQAYVNPIKTVLISNEAEQVINIDFLFPVTVSSSEGQEPRTEELRYKFLDSDDETVEVDINLYTTAVILRQPEDDEGFIGTITLTIGDNALPSDVTQFQIHRQTSTSYSECPTDIPSSGTLKALRLGVKQLFRKVIDIEVGGVTVSSDDVGGGVSPEQLAGKANVNLDNLSGVDAAATSTTLDYYQTDEVDAAITAAIDAIPPVTPGGMGISEARAMEIAQEVDAVRRFTSNPNGHSSTLGNLGVQFYAKNNNTPAVLGNIVLLGADTSDATKAALTDATNPEGTLTIRQGNSAKSGFITIANGPGNSPGSLILHINNVNEADELQIPSVEVSGVLYQHPSLSDVTVTVAGLVYQRWIFRELGNADRHARVYDFDTHGASDLVLDATHVLDAEIPNYVGESGVDEEGQSWVAISRTELIKWEKEGQPRTLPFDAHNLQEFNSNATYVVRTLVTYLGDVYECTVPVTTVGPFDLINWKRKTVEEVFDISDIPEDGKRGELYWVINEADLYEGHSRMPASRGTVWKSGEESPVALPATMTPFAQNNARGFFASSLLVGVKISPGAQLSLDTSAAEISPIILDGTFLGNPHRMALVFVDDDDIRLYTEGTTPSAIQFPPEIIIVSETQGRVTWTRGSGVSTAAQFSSTDTSLSAEYVPYTSSGNAPGVGERVTSIETPGDSDLDFAVKVLVTGKNGEYYLQGNNKAIWKHDGSAWALQIPPKLNEDLSNLPSDLSGDEITSVKDKLDIKEKTESDTYKLDAIDRIPKSRPKFARTEWNTKSNTRYSGFSHTLQHKSALSNGTTFGSPVQYKGSTTQAVAHLYYAVAQNCDIFPDSSHNVDMFYISEAIGSTSNYEPIINCNISTSPSLVPGAAERIKKAIFLFPDGSARQINYIGPDRPLVIGQDSFAIKDNYREVVSGEELALLDDEKPILKDGDILELSSRYTISADLLALTKDVGDFKGGYYSEESETKLIDNFDTSTFTTDADDVIGGAYRSGRDLVIGMLNKRFIDVDLPFRENPSEINSSNASERVKYILEQRGAGLSPNNVGVTKVFKGMDFFTTAAVTRLMSLFTENDYDNALNISIIISNGSRTNEAANNAAGQTSTYQSSISVVAPAITARVTDIMTHPNAIDDTSVYALILSDESATGSVKIYQVSSSLTDDDDSSSNITSSATINIPSADIPPDRVPGSQAKFNWDATNNILEIWFNQYNRHGVERYVSRAYTLGSTQNLASNTLTRSPDNDRLLDVRIMENLQAIRGQGEDRFVFLPKEIKHNIPRNVIEISRENQEGITEVNNKLNNKIVELARPFNEHDDATQLLKANFIAGDSSSRDNTYMILFGEAGQTASETLSVQINSLGFGADLSNINEVPLNGQNVQVWDDTFSTSSEAVLSGMAGGVFTCFDVEQSNGSYVGYLTLDQDVQIARGVTEPSAGLIAAIYPNTIFYLGATFTRAGFTHNGARVNLADGEGYRNVGLVQYVSTTRPNITGTHDTQHITDFSSTQSCETAEPACYQWYRFTPHPTNGLTIYPGVPGQIGIRKDIDPGYSLDWNKRLGRWSVLTGVTDEALNEGLSKSGLLDTLGAKEDVFHADQATYDALDDAAKNDATKVHWIP